MSKLSPRIFRFQVVTLLVAGLTVGGITLASFGSTESAWVTVNADKEFDDDVSLDEDLEVYLVKKDERTIALSYRGPYFDEPMAYCPSSELFEGPRSGSKFDKYGRFFAGPAPRGMSRYPVRVRAGDIQVNAGELIPGPGRNGPALQPAGRYCIPY